MTISNKFFNWQTAGTSNPRYAQGPSPALVSIKEYVLKRWGGQDLGLYGVRPVRGGTALSSHSFGAAWDWRWQSPGPGRAVVLNEVIPFLINYSLELGVQSIHDYVGGQIWHADRNAWRIQTKSSATGMGYSWATWLHTEVHPDVWDDGRSVEEKLGIVEFPPFDPAAGEFSLWPFAAKPIIRLGAKGDVVRYMQGVMRVKLGYAIGIDGNWGPITNNFVIWFQTSQGLTADGIVGPKTWAKIDQIALS